MIDNQAKVSASPSIITASGQILRKRDSAADVGVVGAVEI